MRDTHVSAICWNRMDERLLNNQDKLKKRGTHIDETNFWRGFKDKTGLLKWLNGSSGRAVYLYMLEVSWEVESTVDL